LIFRRLFPSLSDYAKKRIAHGIPWQNLQQVDVQAGYLTFTAENGVPGVWEKLPPSQVLNKED
jgi:hypothetical protein